MLGFWEYIRDIWPHIYLIVYWIYIAIIALVIIFVITDDKSPVKTLAWVMVLIFLPIAGLVLYIFFGQNFRKQKIFSRKGLEDFRQIEKLRFEQLQYLDRPEITHYRPAYKKMHIMKLLLNNSKSIISQNNKIKVLNDGKEKFPELISALKKAKHHIHIEYYIFEYDSIGKEICDILIEKASKGVEVRMIIDHVGSWHFPNKKINALKASGIKLQKFMPVTFPYFTSKINYRNHRKIVVIDGNTGFVGGINVAEKYIHGTKQLGAWHDMHLKIQGNAVHSLQTVFLTDWYFLTKELPTAEIYFPEINEKHESIVQIAASGPDSSWAGIMQTYFSAIATAREYIYIATPYLLPNPALLTALKTASLSGVDVRLIIPRKSDSRIVTYASLSFISELLNAGIKVYFFQEGFIHSKTMVVDSIMSSVGTANLDYRSLSVNFEVNALIYDETTSQRLRDIFMSDLAKSTLITKENWKQRSKITLLKSSIARVFSPLM
ncbi:MAG TPA: cardiolipin synthase [Salinivirga sp.]|uniref:cardiolipin synthase n=1 Tax=Salinivirga sp. TaxID=1970192 RepID=UPI002B49A123|nr:cardiolipin synthase [Salinivirga sp.]HKK59427.1 cardiolipin synthase [Salinivirga sp.]